MPRWAEQFIALLMFLTAMFVISGAVRDWWNCLSCPIAHSLGQDCRADWSYWKCEAWRNAR
jgi:hypothetical protein